MKAKKEQAAKLKAQLETELENELDRAMERRQARLQSGVPIEESLAWHIADLADIRDWYDGELAKMKGLDNA